MRNRLRACRKEVLAWLCGFGLLVSCISVIFIYPQSLPTQPYESSLMDPVRLNSAVVQGQAKPGHREGMRRGFWSSKLCLLTSGTGPLAF